MAGDDSGGHVLEVDSDVASAHLCSPFVAVVQAQQLWGLRWRGMGCGGEACGWKKRRTH